jgi:hypothetical protein
MTKTGLKRDADVLAETSDPKHDADALDELLEKAQVVGGRVHAFTSR